MVPDREVRALEHVTKAQHIVARQRELIAAIKARGGECGKAEDLLSAFERSLAIFEDDLAAVGKEKSLA